MTYYTHYPSPIGDLLMTSDGEALTTLQPAEILPVGAVWAHQPHLPLFSQVQAWLDDYFRGSPPDPRTLPLSPAGTAFQHRVWDLLLDIPWGKTRSYGDIAREISPRMAPQAIGGAVGRNPIAIIIPCHRILGAGGALTGYAWGTEKKAWLLCHEGHHFQGGTL